MQQCLSLPVGAYPRRLALNALRRLPSRRINADQVAKTYTKSGNSSDSHPFAISEEQRFLHLGTAELPFSAASLPPRRSTRQGGIAVLCGFFRRDSLAGDLSGDVFYRHQRAFLPGRKRRDLISDNVKPAIWLQESQIGFAGFRSVLA